MCYYYNKTIGQLIRIIIILIRLMSYYYKHNNRKQQNIANQFSTLIFLPYFKIPFIFYILFTQLYGFILARLSHQEDLGLLTFKFPFLTAIHSRLFKNFTNNSL